MSKLSAQGGRAAGAALRSVVSRQSSLTLRSPAQPPSLSRVSRDVGNLESRVSRLESRESRVAPGLTFVCHLHFTFPLYALVSMSLGVSAIRLYMDHTGISLGCEHTETVVCQCAAARGRAPETLLPPRIVLSPWSGGDSAHHPPRGCSEARLRARRPRRGAPSRRPRPWQARA